MHYLSQLFFLSLLFQAVSVFSSDTFDFSSGNAFPQQEKFLSVDQAYRADVLVKKDKSLQLFWQIEPKHYLYHHGFTLEGLTGKDSVKLGKTDFKPEGGQSKEDPYFGEVTAYYDSVLLDLPLFVKDEPVFIKAGSQGCADAGLCYPPYAVYFRVNPDLSVEPVDKAAFDAHKNQLGDQGSGNTGEPPGNLSLGKLLSVLLAAFLGGLILNLMPCVLPVLSLKVFQMTGSEDKSGFKAQGLAYLAGVVLSFLLVALLMIGLRAAGSEIGWGFQLQNPWLVALLVYVFVILGLALSGLVELGAGFMGAGQGLTNRKGVSGSFFTGVLSVVVASPCTAPFMGSALGFASVQPTGVALLVFLFLGLGMAMPLTLICFVPGAAKWLPKSGAWMEKLREFFAFPLYLTAIWLLWVLGKQTDIHIVALVLVGCVLIAFGLWSFRQWVVAGRVLGILALLLSLGIVFGPVRQSNPLHQENRVVFTQEKLDALRSEGQAVFVDLTADWCITCKTNELTTLNTEAVQQALIDANIVFMVGDWTNYNPEVTALLKRYGRNSVPLYLLFPHGVNKEPQILPQILTKKIVIDAIRQADQKRM